MSRTTEHGTDAAPAPGTPCAACLRWDGRAVPAEVVDPRLGPLCLTCLVMAGNGLLDEIEFAPFAAAAGREA